MGHRWADDPGGCQGPFPPFIRRTVAPQPLGVCTPEKFYMHLLFYPLSNEPMCLGCFRRDLCAIEKQSQWGADLLLSLGGDHLLRVFRKCLRGPIYLAIT